MPPALRSCAEPATNRLSSPRMPILLCPLRFEAAVLRRATGLEPRVTGPGAPAAARAVERLDAAEVAEAGGVLLAGLAGGLAEDRPAGGAWIVTEVLDAASLALAPTLRPGVADDLLPCRLISVRAVVADRAAKRGLRARSGADLVDLEGRAFAEAAERRGMPWAILRGISDDAATALPSWIGELVDARGASRPLAAARRLATAPRWLPTLRRLARDGRRALEASAPLVARYG